MIVNLKNLIDDDLFYNYFTHKVTTIKPNGSLKLKPIRGRIGYIGYDFYSDYLTMLYHSKITKTISEKINKKIIPSFCFTRYYYEDSVLNFHKDRPECEITVSHCHYGEPWKIYVEDDEYITQTGVSICYQGIDRSHGRIQKLKNKSLYSFFHWVEFDGNYENHKFDKSVFSENVYRKLDKPYI